MRTAELVEKIDAKWNDWSIWRTAEKSWVVHVRGVKTFSEETIEGALQAAADYVPLPEIPREPQLPRAFDVVKDGSKWCLVQGGRHYCGNLPTKKKALELAETFRKDAVAMREQWIKQHLHFVETHTEGVDFRWAS